MRLMLGRNNTPSLLVSVDSDFNIDKFDFRVVNGAWDGTYTNGYITTKGCPSSDFTSLDKMTILCSNQDRLRGDYNTVFGNFDNPNYVAPQYKYTPEDIVDDDIPF